MNKLSTTPATATLLAKPLLLWLTVQLIALAIGAVGFPLSARKPVPPETLSIQIMLVTQIAAAALLWPLLFLERRASLAVIATAIPFAQAAAFLSVTPRGDAYAAVGLVLVWLIALGVLPARRPGLTMILRAAVILWSIGGAIVTYLQADFSLDAIKPVGPIVYVLAALDGKSSSGAWVIAGFSVLVALAARLLCNAIRTPR